jgi:flagellar assembly protein FliH
MATVLRASDPQFSPQVASFNLDDVAAEAAECLAQARADAAEIVATAEGQAADIRRQAAEAGCKAAMQEFEKIVAAQVAPAIEALGQTVVELHREKQAWIAHWETGAVHLAAAIAARVIRREVRQEPEITLTLVREALDLAAGSPNVRLHLNPEDYKSLGVQVRTLIDAMSALGDAEVIPDAAVAQGGCRVETRFGTIDQQIETQLHRIEEELAA